MPPASYPQTLPYVAVLSSARCAIFSAPEALHIAGWEWPASCSAQGLLPTPWQAAWCVREVGSDLLIVAMADGMLHVWAVGLQVPLPAGQELYLGSWQGWAPSRASAAFVSASVQHEPPTLFLGMAESCQVQAVPLQRLVASGELNTKSSTQVQQLQAIPAHSSGRATTIAASPCVPLVAVGTSDGIVTVFLCMAWLAHSDRAEDTRSALAVRAGLMGTDSAFVPVACVALRSEWVANVGSSKLTRVTVGNRVTSAAPRPDWAISCLRWHRTLPVLAMGDGSGHVAVCRCAMQHDEVSILGTTRLAGPGFCAVTDLRFHPHRPILQVVQGPSVQDLSVPAVASQAMTAGAWIGPAAAARSGAEPGAALAMASLAGPRSVAATSTASAAAASSSGAPSSAHGMGSLAAWFSPGWCRALAAALAPTVSWLAASDPELRALTSVRLGCAMSQALQQLALPEQSMALAALLNSATRSSDALANAVAQHVRAWKAGLESADSVLRDGSKPSATAWDGSAATPASSAGLPSTALLTAQVMLCLATGHADSVRGALELVTQTSTTAQAALTASPAPASSGTLSAAGFGSPVFVHSPQQSGSMTVGTATGTWKGAWAGALPAQFGWSSEVPALWQPACFVGARSLCAASGMMCQALVPAALHAPRMPWWHAHGLVVTPACAAPPTRQLLAGWQALGITPEASQQGWPGVARAIAALAAPAEAAPTTANKAAYCVGSWATASMNSVCMLLRWREGQWDAVVPLPNASSTGFTSLVPAAIHSSPDGVLHAVQLASLGCEQRVWCVVRAPADGPPAVSPLFVAGQVCPVAAQGMLLHDTAVDVQRSLATWLDCSGPLQDSAASASGLIWLQAASEPVPDMLLPRGASVELIEPVPPCSLAAWRSHHAQHAAPAILACAITHGRSTAVYMCCTPGGKACTITGTGRPLQCAVQPVHAGMPGLSVQPCVACLCTDHVVVCSAGLVPLGQASRHTPHGAIVQLAWHGALLLGMTDAGAVVSIALPSQWAAAMQPANSRLCTVRHLQSCIVHSVCSCGAEQPARILEMSEHGLWLATQQPAGEGQQRQQVRFRAWAPGTALVLALSGLLCAPDLQAAERWAVLSQLLTAAVQFGHPAHAVPAAGGARVRGQHHPGTDGWGLAAPGLVALQDIGLHELALWAACGGDVSRRAPPSTSFGLKPSEPQALAAATLSAVQNALKISAYKPSAGAVELGDSDAAPPPLVTFRDDDVAHVLNCWGQAHRPGIDPVLPWHLAIRAAASQAGPELTAQRLRAAFWCAAALHPPLLGWLHYALPTKSELLGSGHAWTWEPPDELPPLPAEGSTAQRCLLGTAVLAEVLGCESEAAFITALCGRMAQHVRDADTAAPSAACVPLGTIARRGPLPAAPALSTCVAAAASVTASAAVLGACLQQLEVPALHDEPGPALDAARALQAALQHSSMPSTVFLQVAPMPWPDSNAALPSTVDSVMAALAGDVSQLCELAPDVDADALASGPLGQLSSDAAGPQAETAGDTPSKGLAVLGRKEDAQVLGYWRFEDRDCSHTPIPESAVACAIVDLSKQGAHGAVLGARAEPEHGGAWTTTEDAPFDPGDPKRCGVPRALAAHKPGELACAAWPALLEACTDEAFLGALKRAHALAACPAAAIVLAAGTHQDVRAVPWDAAIAKWTLEAWVRVGTEAAGFGQGVVLACREAGAQVRDPGWSWGVSSAGALYFEVPGVARVEARADQALSAGKWRHVAVTVNGAAALQGAASGKGDGIAVQLFIDAKDAGSGTLAMPEPGLPATESVHALQLLSHVHCPVEITEVRLWGVARTAVQLQDAKDFNLDLAESKRKKFAVAISSGSGPSAAPAAARFDLRPPPAAAGANARSSFGIAPPSSSKAALGKAATLRPGAGFGLPAPSNINARRRTQAGGTGLTVPSRAAKARTLSGPVRPAGASGARAPPAEES